MSGLSLSSEEPGRHSDHTEQDAAAAERARAIARDAAARRGQIGRRHPPKDGGTALPPIFERYVERQTGAHVIVPVTRTRTRSGAITATPMPPLYGGKIRNRPPARRTAPPCLPPEGTSAGSGLVWAGYLERCVCPETGEVYFLPVVFIIEAAVAPNNKPVIR